MKFAEMILRPSDLPGPTPSKEDYRSVVDSAQLTAIFLVSSSFEMAPSYFSSLMEGTMDARRLEYGWNVAALEPNPDDGCVNGVFDWYVWASSSDDEEGSRDLSIRAQYFIGYDQIENGEERAMVQFFNNIGRMATYPYFRAFVHHISCEAQADLPPLPMIRL